MVTYMTCELHNHRNQAGGDLPFIQLPANAVISNLELTLFWEHNSTPYTANFIKLKLANFFDFSSG